MKLIVGLGNPGKEYEGTRHNVGFEVLDAYAAENKVDLSRSKFEALYGEFEKEGEKILLILPQTYMNLSGRSVGKFLQFYKLSPQDLLVIHDELDLPLGSMKVVRKAGAAGNRGVISIQESLATQEFARFRIGIGKPERSEQTADYVLKKFQKAERELLQAIVDKSIKGLDLWLRKGIEPCMAFCHTNE